MGRIGDFTVECPANQWTLINQGSYPFLGRTYTLRSVNTVRFEWRWRGSGLPFQRKRSSDDLGVANFRVPTSAIWRLKAKPVEDTVIIVDIEE